MASICFLSVSFMGWNLAADVSAQSATFKGFTPIIQLNDGAVALSFDTKLGNYYSLEVSPNLQAWTDTAIGCHGTGERVTLKTTLGDGNSAFFRLVESIHLNTVYFVSPTGDDLNSGLTPDQPLRHIQTAADLMQHGDVCYLRAGEYREQVIVPAIPNSQGQYRIFRSYPGERAILRGDDPVPQTGWMVHSPSIYKRSWPTPVDALYVEGQEKWIARWPNALSDDPLDPTFSFMELGTTSLAPYVGGTRSYFHRIVDSQIGSPSGNWSDAKVWLTGRERWWSRTALVTNHPNAGQFDLQIHPGAPSTNLWAGVTPAVTSPYYLYDHLELLDSPGEWYYDDTAAILYVHAGNGEIPPEVSVYDYQRSRWAFDLEGCERVQLIDMDFFSCSIYAGDTHQCTFRQLTMRAMDPIGIILDAQVREHMPFYIGKNVGLTGLTVSGTGNTVEYCEISHSWGDAICLQGSGHRILYNRLHDIDYQGNAMSGVSSYGSDHDIRNNHIWRTGRSGMRPYLSSGGLIAQNYIHDIGHINWDLGGIYMYHARGNPQNPLKISGNLIHDIQIDKAYGPSDFQYSGSAIYLDGASSCVTIRRNLCYDYRMAAVQLNSAAFYSQENENILIEHNTFINIPYDGTWDGMWRGCPVWGLDLGGKINTYFRNNAIWKNQHLELPGVIYGNNVSLAETDVVDAAMDDYRLSSISSAIDAVPVIPGVSNEYTGGGPDAGAFEFGSQIWDIGIPFPILGGRLIGSFSSGAP